MQNPRVGVGVCITKGTKVLLGQRLNAHGHGTWCFPGGHLEFGETWEVCAIRETQEETGIEITDIGFLAATNDIFETEDKHYVTIYMKAEWMSGDPQVLEPNKMVKWDWFEWNN